MKEKGVICFLDKEYPPQHSFVDGFLCDSDFVNQIDPTLVVTKIDKIQRDVLYRNVSTKCYLSQRRGFGRILRFYESIRLIWKLNAKKVFIRNDPIILFAMFILKKIGIIDKIIFQNSFPHEQNGFILGGINKIIYKLTLNYVDYVYVVTPNAISRLMKYGVEASKFRIVPLFLQEDMLYQKKENKNFHEENIKFIYIGTLAKIRKIDFFLSCFYEASLKYKNFKIDIVGGTQLEIDDLMKNDFIKILVFNDILKFHGQVSRDLVSVFLKKADIGISIIPPIEIYLESSPTKLAEYLGHSIPVLVSKGIPFQDKISNLTEACIQTEYNREDLIRCIELICSYEYDISYLSTKAFNFSIENLTYKKVIQDYFQDFL